MDNVALLEELLGLLRTINQSGMTGPTLEDKNVLQGDNPSDPNKKLKSTLSNSEKKRTLEIASLFAQTFFEYKKKQQKDTSLKTSIQRITPPALPKSTKVEPPPSNKPGLMLAGLLTLLGGAAALIIGLVTDGPFKGALKILSKIGIKGGLKMLVSGSKLFLETISKFVTAPFRFASKILGKTGLGKMAAKFFKPLLKVLKKVPLIGSLISIGFAVSRFKQGDVTGGVIDLLSALSGLLVFVPGGIVLAPLISTGLDVLNAWLDYKAVAPENKGKGKLDILGEMAGKIGKWIWDRSLYLPVIGGIKRWGMAYDQFSNGNILEGLKQLGLGLLTFVGGGPIIYGIEMLMGMFGNEEKSQTDLNIDTSWTTKLKDWIKKKLKDLPYVLRKPLEWFGIIDEQGNTTMSLAGVKDSFNVMTEKISEFVGPLWDSIWNGVGDAFNKIKENIGPLWDSIWNNMRDSIGWVSEKLSNGFESVKTMFTSAFETLISYGSEIKQVISDIIGKVVSWVKNLWPFGGGEDESGMSESQKSERAKQAGYTSWDEYKNANWQWKENSQNIPTVTASASPNAPSILEEVANAQLKTLRDIHQVTYSIYQSVKGGIGGGGSNTMIPIPMNSSSQSNSQPRMMPMNSNRGDYGSSPYALA